MTKEEFLASVALSDKTKGNYEYTLQPHIVEQRNKRLWQATERFIALYEYLVKAGYNVFVQEMLAHYKEIDWTKRRKKRGPLPKPRSFGRFAHMYIPELNLAIRFTHIEKGGYDPNLGKFIYRSRPYCYICVINPDEDAVEKFRSVRDKVKEYARGETPKKGIAKNLIVPKPKVKRRRMVVSQRV